MAETAKKLNRSGRSHSGYFYVSDVILRKKTMRAGKERKLTPTARIITAAISGFSKGENTADFTYKEISERYSISEKSAARGIKTGLESKIIERAGKVSKYKFKDATEEKSSFEVEDWLTSVYFDFGEYTDRLNPNEVLILSLIRSYCRAQKGTAIWKSSNSFIAKSLEIVTSTVSAALERLKAAKLIYIKGRAKNKFIRATFSVNEKALTEAKKNTVKRAKGISEEAKAAELRAERDRFYAHRQKAVLDRVEKLRARARADEAFREAEDALRALELDIAKAEYHHLPTLPDLLEQKRGNEAQRAARLAALGMMEEDLIPRYYCEKCSDKGFLPDGRMCDCYQRGRR